MQNNDTKLAFGRFLKFWRSVHSVSQEELAGRLGSSPRHISRLENGSSRASESLVLDIARVLNLGRRDLNHLLIAAGYAPNEEPVDFNAPELKWLRKAMTMHLRTLDPYPASVVDGSANILMVNRGWVKFYGKVVDEQALASVSNFYDFLFAQAGAENAGGSWADTLSAILMSIQQSALLTGDGRAEETLKRLQAYPGVPVDWRLRAAHTEPMASFRVQINVAGELKRFFSVGTMAGALGPSAFASQPHLSIITLYPEDEVYDFGLLKDEVLKHPLLSY
ncbi:helix-turn-helix domain-containing protein [Zhongshania sp.]|uniref:helix-turn-helix domain-containing protein n=1 Tax=Zhongshania sp. TaxID=1971902 RepID=UPI00356704C3